MRKTGISRVAIFTLSLLLFSGLALGGNLTGQGPHKAFAADVRLIVDGREIATDVAPIIEDGRTLVPVRAVSEALDAQVAWQEDLQIVSVAKGDMVLILQANTQEYHMNGRIYTLDVPVRLYNSRAMVPIRVISEAFGAGVEWDQETFRVIISLAGPAPETAPKEDVLHQYGSVRVKHNQVNLRQGPNTTSPILGQANEGDVFTLTGKVNDWYQIRRPDGSAAYVANWLADIYDPSRPLAQGDQAPQESETPQPPPHPEPTPSPSPSPAPSSQVEGKTFASRYDRVNLRSGPGTSFATLGQVNKGAQFTGVREENGWILLQWQGRDVWVRQDLVTSDLSLLTGDTSSPEEQDPLAPPHQVSVLETNREHGQASLVLSVGTAKVTILSNTKETLLIEVDGAQVPAGLQNPVAGTRPFTDLALTNISDRKVQITAKAETGGYFRLDRSNDRFTLTAVAKHKDGNLGLKGKTIVLDPGHGNYSGGTVDPGAISKHNGLKEIDFNTNVLMYLKDMLEAQGAKVYMTRGYDPVHITLAQRAQLANDHSADAFISLHGDSAANTSAYGAGTWLYTGDKRLTSAAQKDVRNALASSVNAAIAKATGRPAYIKYENFAVTRETKIPSILVEAGFLSNPEDAALLATEDYQRKLAQGLYNGLDAYFAY